jgi:hypothetical protein
MFQGKKIKIQVPWDPYIAVGDNSYAAAPMGLKRFKGKNVFFYSSFCKAFSRFSYSVLFSFDSYFFSTKKNF